VHGVRTEQANKMKLLRGGRIQTNGRSAPERREILIADNGCITALLKPGEVVADAASIDLDGKLVVAGLVDAHQHLDKSHTLPDVPNPQGTLESAIAAFNQYAARMTHEEIARHAERTLHACMTRGTVAIRTHVNIDTECRLRNIEALLDVRERWRDRVQLQIVAFLTSGGPNAPEAADWLATALDAGVDVIGGTPNRASDPERFLDMLFDAAVRSGRPIDLHLDEHLDPSMQHFEGVIRRTRTLGLAGRVVASHCSVLSALPPDDAQRLIDGFAEAGIGVVTLPAANLFLQGRHADRLAPRGLTRVNELAKAGVTVACASDNIRDPFVPTGSGDMLEIARWTLLAAHMGSGDLGRAFDMVTDNPARLLGIDHDYGLRSGARADLLITDAHDAADLVAGGSLERAVLFAGKLVAGRL
jgi:cytosine deaminase